MREGQLGRSSIFKAGLALALLTTSVTAGWAQVSATTAGVTGVVTDATKGLLPGVTVLLRNVGTGWEHSEVTAADGSYRFVGVDPGTYQVKFELTGFKTVMVVPVSLIVGTQPRVDAVLELGQVTESVTVVGQSALIETTKSTLSQTVEQRELETIPINSRNPVELVLLTPNTVPSVSRRDNGIYINVSGGRAREPILNLDGLDNIDDSNSQQRALFSREAIREFQVLANNFTAEFGRTQGAIVNVVTKSGTNQFDGNFYLNQRNKALNSRNAFETDKAPFRRWQEGGTFGGPIKQNRMFFFFAAERQDAKIPAFTSVTAATAGLLGIPLSDIGEIPREDNHNSFIGKYSYQVNSSNSVDFAYVYSLADQLRQSTVGGLNTLRRAGSKDSYDSFFNANWRMVRGSTVHETRVAFSPRNFEFWFSKDKPADWTNDSPEMIQEPTVSVSGVANFGLATGNHFTQDKTYLIDSLTWFKSKHDVKIGIDFLWGKNYRFIGGNRNGSYSFSNIANFLAGRYTQYSQLFGNSTVTPQHNLYGFFAQDNYRVSSHVTLNAGLRYDIETLPEFYDPEDRAVGSSDLNNLAPRGGIAWDVFGNGNTIVRGGSGIFYTRRFINQVANLQTGSPSRGSYSYIFAFGAAGAPTYPNRLTTQPTGAASTPNITATFGIPVPWSVQANAAVEQRLTRTMVVAVEYNNNKSWTMASARDINAPDPVTGRRPRTDVARISLYDSEGRALYQGISFKLRRQVSQGFAFQTFYTLALDKNDSQDFSDLPTNQNDRSADYGWSVDDVRHRWVMSGTYLLPKLSALGGAFSGLQLSGAATYRSPFPVDAPAGSDLNRDGVVNDRAPGLARNSFRAYDFFVIDFRLTKILPIGDKNRLELVAEAFNLLNRTNYDAVNTSYGPGPAPVSTFRAPVSAYDPRQIQFGVKVSF